MFKMFNNDQTYILCDVELWSYIFQEKSVILIIISFLSMMSYHIVFGHVCLYSDIYSYNQVERDRGWCVHQDFLVQIQPQHVTIY